MSKLKLFILGFIGITTIASYTLADNFESCKENESCLYCMCENLYDYNNNECSIQEEECYESCGEEDDCSYCGEDAQNCLQDAYVQFDDCLIGPEILNDWNLNHGACYGQWLPGGGNEGGNEGGDEGGNEGGQIILGGFDNFTPAVDGLHTTVKQLIPLVIYLGIGVLVVILGFIAIRWLVNWMSNGINSKFSSKRG